MDSYLITGAGGFIGSHVVSKIAETNHVYAVMRPGVAISQLHKNTKVVFLDLNSDWRLSDLPVQIDGVMHLAQSENYRQFPNSTEEVFRVNLQSTFKLLDYAAKIKVKKFIYASTGGLYTPSPRPLNEDSPIAARGALAFYLSTKLGSEALCESYSGLFDTTLLRLFFVYGPRQKRHMLFPRLLDQIRLDKPITLVGQEGILINPTYVEDVAEAFSNALNLTGFNKFNIAGDEIVSIRKIAEFIAKAAHKEIRFETKENGIAQDLIADITRMKNILGCPKTDLATGINRFINTQSPPQ